MGKRFIRSDWNIVVIGVYSRLVYVAVLPRKEYIYSIRESVVTYEIVIYAHHLNTMPWCSHIANLVPL